MGLKSMTGFGAGKASAGGVHVAVEISSVNRKQLDVNISLPRNLVALDARVQSRVRREFSRGRVSGVVRVEAEDGSAGTVKIDSKLAAQYVDGIRTVAKKLKLADDLGAATLARLPGLVLVEQDDLDADHVGVVLDGAMDKALQGLAKMRATEGKALATDLRSRVLLLEEGMTKIKTLSSLVTESYRAKLLQRLDEAGLEDLAADERIVKEVALFADRCDISEELTRLKSHLAQIISIIQHRNTFLLKLQHCSYLFCHTCFCSFYD